MQNPLRARRISAYKQSGPRSMDVYQTTPVAYNILGAQAVTINAGGSGVDAAASGGVLPLGASNAATVTVGNSNTATFVNGPLSVSSRLFGKPVNSNDAFWIGLQGTAAESQRQAIGIASNVSTGAVDSIQLYTAGAPRMFVNSNGNVGIGTNQPLANLHVSISNATITIGSNQWVGTASNTTTYGLVRSTNTIQFMGYRDIVANRVGAKICGLNKQTFDDTSNRQYVQSTDIAFYTLNPQNLSSDADATVERMRITDTGNVGINVTNPINILCAAGKVTVGSGADAQSTTFHDGMLNIIGGSTRATLRIENNNSVGSPAIIFGEGGTFTEDTVPTIKKVQGTDNLAIMSAGSVGIGTTGPGAKLDVNGSIKVSTGIYTISWDHYYEAGNVTTWSQVLSSSSVYMANVMSVVNSDLRGSFIVYSGGNSNGNYVHTIYNRYVECIWITDTQLRFSFNHPGAQLVRINLLKMV